jgi:predicted ATPase
MSHLYKIGLENFRLFKEMQEFDFAPITLLTGVNNSGKSSIIKSLLLLKESFNKSVFLSELLFTESKHNLGTFDQCVNNQNKNKQYLKFKFQLPNTVFGNDCSIELTYIPNSNFAENGILQAFCVNCKDKAIINFSRSLELKDEDKENSADAFSNFHHSIEYKIDINFIQEFIRNKYSTVTKQIKKEFTSDQINETKSEIFSWENQFMGEENYIEHLKFSNSSLHSFFVNPAPFHDDRTESIDFNEPLFFILDKQSGEKVHDERTHNALKKSIDYLSKFGRSMICGGDLPIVPEPALFDLFLQYIKPSIVTSFVKKNQDQEIALSDFGEFVFNDVLRMSIIKPFHHILTATKNIYSLSSLRGNTERLYSNNSEIVDINKIIMQFLEYNINSNHSFINKSLKHFNIGDRLSIERHQGVASEIFITQGSEKKLLADLGFGYTQLLPIILKVAIIGRENFKKEAFVGSGLGYNPSILILEEPESNLHPSYQAKLADFIIDAANEFNIQFIIETHSEYLIRKFQYLVAKEDLKTKDICIYYFHEPNSIPSGEQQVKKIEILNDGSLTDDFGSGFFDEALNWKFELLKLKNKN